MPGTPRGHGPATRLRVAVDVDDEVGGGVGVDADLAAVSDLGEHGVGDDVAGEVGQAGRQRYGVAGVVAGEHGEVALGVGEHGGDVEHHGFGVGGDVAASGDDEVDGRAGGDAADAFVLAVEGVFTGSGLEIPLGVDR